MTRELVVEADGGSRGNPGPAAGGAVVIDPATGEVVAELGVWVGTASNNVAEYRGMIEGVRAAIALDGEAELTVRMDSKLVVEQMMGRWKIKHPRWPSSPPKPARCSPARPCASSGFRAFRTPAPTPSPTRQWMRGPRSVADAPRASALRGFSSTLTG